jgi:hypothetical protein
VFIAQLFVFMLLYTGVMWLLAEIFSRLRRFNDVQGRALVKQWSFIRRGAVQGSISAEGYSGC